MLLDQLRSQLLQPVHVVVISLVFSGLLSLIILAGFRRTEANRISLRILTLILFFEITSQLFMLNRLWESTSPQPPMVTFALLLSLVPLRYAYFTSLARPGFSLRDLTRWNLIPPLIGILMYTVKLPLALSGTVGLLIVIVYMRSGALRLWEFEALAMQTRSCLTQLRLSMLRFLLILCLLSDSILLIASWFSLPFPFWVYSPLVLILSLLGLVYYGLRGSMFLSESLSTGTHAPTVSPTEIERLKDKLLDVLNREQLYLRPQLRLGELAEATGVKSYRLSEVIAQGLHTNFYDLINGLRIERAKEMLSDPSYSHLNLVGIAQDCGFNSKSTFNEVFKRVVGQTPSAYRAAQMSRLASLDDRSVRI